MRPSHVALAGLVCVTAGALAQSLPATAVPDATGSYVLSGPRRAEMTVSATNGCHVVVLAGGGSPAAGAASAADCHIRAVGEMRGHRLVAAFTAVETDTFSYSQDQAQAEARMLEVEFAHDEAIVTRADVVAYCGLGADFLGTYRRNR